MSGEHLKGESNHPHLPLPLVWMLGSSLIKSEDSRDGDCSPCHLPQHWTCPYQSAVLCCQASCFQPVTYSPQSSMASCCSCRFSLLPLKIWCRSQQCSRGSCSSLLWNIPCGVSTVVQWPLALLGLCFWDTSTFCSVQTVASSSENAAGEKEPQVWGQVRAHFAWNYYYVSWKDICYLKKTISKLKNSREIKVSCRAVHHSR